MTPEAIGAIADEFLAVTLGNVDELGKQLRLAGATPEDARNICAQCWLAILYDLFKPNLSFAGAFVNVMSALAHATVVERRDPKDKAH